MTATGIDLNCDMGELWPLQTDGTQARLVRAVSSVNIACGAHAGDEALIPRGRACDRRASRLSRSRELRPGSAGHVVRST
jgi:lactam utilization protein B